MINFTEFDLEYLLRAVDCLNNHCLEMYPKHCDTVKRYESGEYPRDDNFFIDDCATSMEYRDLYYQFIQHYKSIKYKLYKLQHLEELRHLDES